MQTIKFYCESMPAKRAIEEIHFKGRNKLVVGNILVADNLAALSKIPNFAARLVDESVAHYKQSGQTHFLTFDYGETAGISQLSLRGNIREDSTSKTSLPGSNKHHIQLVVDESQLAHPTNYMSVKVTINAQRQDDHQKPVFHFVILDICPGFRLPWVGKKREFNYTEKMGLFLFKLGHEGCIHGNIDHKILQALAPINS